MTMQTKEENIYAYLAEFSSPEELLEAAKKSKAEGYNNVEAYSPFPIHHLAETLGMKKTILPTLVLGGGILGGIAGFAMQYYASVISYPLNIGGRPMNSWPAFIPITFEMTVLGAALTAVFGMLALNGLPMPYHPVFNVDRFENVTKDGFFLSVRSTDPKFDLVNTKKFLETIGAKEVFEVEP